ncbi:MAG TPA: biotin/lipoyl-binding protein, partial [Microvirga sp.]|nr:biotin/lipoyl-binding protein [Microvirga sp.]
MRVIGQLAVIALLGAAGYGGWYAHKEGLLVEAPVVGPYIAKLIPQPAAGGPARTAGGAGGRGGPGGQGGAPPVVEVDSVKTGRIVETREAVGTVRAFESITVTAKVAGIIDKIEFQEGQKVKAGDLLVSFDTQERRADIEAAVAESRRAAAQRNEISTRLER